MGQNLPGAKVYRAGGIVMTTCSTCRHTAAYCFCADNGYSRQELNYVALAILFGYDLSGVDENVMEDVRETLVVASLRLLDLPA